MHHTAAIPAEENTDKIQIADLKGSIISEQNNAALDLPKQKSSLVLGW